MATEPTVGQKFTTNKLTGDPNIVGTTEYLGNGQWKVSDSFHGDYGTSFSTEAVKSWGIDVPDYTGAPGATQSYQVDNSNSQNEIQGRANAAGTPLDQIPQGVNHPIGVTGSGIYDGKNRAQSQQVIEPGQTEPNHMAPAPQAPQAPQAQAPQAAAPIAPPTPGVPAGGWAPGHTGADVSALQNFLVGKGFMTAAQVATGPGIYGPKTQAALASYQASTGTATAPHPSAATDAVTPSPYVNTPATDSTPPVSAVQQVINDYTTAYKALGLGDIKAQYQSFVQQEADLASKKAGEAAKISNNPWMTQSEKDRSLNQLDSRYKSEETILTNKVALLDSLYKQGQAEVENIVSKSEAISMEQQKEAAAIAQRKQDAIDALTLEAAKKADTHSASYTEWKDYQSTGGKLSFSDYQTMDANRKAVRSTTVNSTPKTLAERKAESLAELQAGIDSGGKLPGGVAATDPNGYITPAALKIFMSQAASNGLNSSDVLGQVANSLAPNYDKNGNPVSGTISSNYGLTPVQIKSITGV